VRTKYDRMFERKNQNILSSHYSKLVDHGDAVDDDDDFITLKRSNHDLSDTDVHPEIDNLSKRKLKLSRTKRAVVKYGQLGQRLIFDDQGNPHEIYEMVDPAEFYKSGLEGAKEAGKAFVEGEKGKLKDADVVDKMEARDKKREKKRKRKERENGVSSALLRRVNLLNICSCRLIAMMSTEVLSRNLHILMRMDISRLGLNCLLKVMMRMCYRPHPSGVNVQLRPKVIRGTLKKRKSLHYGCYATADRVGDTVRMQFIEVHMLNEASSVNQSLQRFRYSDQLFQRSRCRVCKTKKKNRCIACVDNTHAR
jgi:hypothetical protein